jgi:hypothetical protein
MAVHVCMSPAGIDNPGARGDGLTGWEMGGDGVVYGLDLTLPHPFWASLHVDIPLAPYPKKP